MKALQARGVALDQDRAEALAAIQIRRIEAAMTCTCQACGWLLERELIRRGWPPIEAAADARQVQRRLRGERTARARPQAVRRRAGLETVVSWSCGMLIVVAVWLAIAAFGGGVR